MKSRQLIAGALLCLSLIGATEASTRSTNLGALSDGDFGIVGNAVAFSRSFDDNIHFALSRTTAIGRVAPVRLVNASWSHANPVGAPAPGKYTFADLAPGSYSVAIFGTAKYLSGYAATSAVPEVETWVMLLIGLALAAYQLHRKQKTLGQQVLNDEASSSA